MPSAFPGNNWMLLSSIRSNLSGQADKQVFALKEKLNKNELTLDAPGLHPRRDKETTKRVHARV